jgi:flagellin-like protein
MGMGSKRGLSPVIATSLLIAIALILGVIIFIWARSFIGESLQKDMGGGNVPIAEACKEVDFSADADSTTGEVIVENKGNVPIYGIEVKKIGIGNIETKNISNKGTISQGDTISISISDLNRDEQINIIPIIVGQSGDSKRQYSCTENSQSVTVL